jgi:predicted Zn-dependent protease
MTISKRGIQMVVVAMSVVTLLTSQRSLACGGDWYPEVQIDPRIRGVAEAEKTLAKGDYVAAAGSVVRMIPQIETLPARGSRDPLLARAARVLSVAIARRGGKLALEREVPKQVLGHWLGKSQVDQRKNLAWSVNTLRRALALKQDDPGLMTELGEALAVLDSGREEARSILESLAERDLVASPQGYKVLAELRQQAGDEAGQMLAMKRCENMAAGSDICASSAPRAS